VAYVDTGRSRMLSIPQVVVLIVVFFAFAMCFVVPMRCSRPVSKPPHPGCRATVYGILGRCHHHGHPAGFRVMAVLGGQRLISRRYCDRCGQCRTYERFADSGRSYLGCAGFPDCKGPVVLGTYTF
jgi:hypothetical protein